ncbi:hypothetical protein D3C72_2246740 [compost metagenome]
MLGNTPRVRSSRRAATAPASMMAKAMAIQRVNSRYTALGVLGLSSMATKGHASSPTTPSAIMALTCQRHARSVTVSSATPASSASAGKIGTI